MHGSKHAGGHDLYAIVKRDENYYEDEELVYRITDKDWQIMIAPHSTVKIHTGLAMEIPEGYFGAIMPRSGLATKEGLRLANCIGVIDSDYRGEIIVAIHNDTNDVKFIKHGDRIAQLSLIKHEEIEFVEVDSLSETERGSGGFGSTGKN